LKQVISKTTKVTKVGRSEVVEKAEDVTHEVTHLDESEDDGEDDDEKSMDLVMDTDGNQKKAVTKYDGEDELMSDAASQIAESDHELAVDFTANAEIETKQKTSELMKLLREKYSKYLPFIKGDLEFIEGKSASITLQFPLEYKKLLILQQAETALKSVLIRNHKDIERVMLMTKEGQEPYLLV
jgi:hypothetical protein